MEKHIDKLKQLDRIEFRQKLDEIEKNNSCNTATTWFMIVIGFVLFANGIFSLGNLFLKISIVFILMDIVCVIINIYRSTKAKKELYQKYFKVQPRK